MPLDLFHRCWVVATQIFFYFHPDPWGRWTQFDGRIFQMDSNGLNRNHQLSDCVSPKLCLCIYGRLFCPKRRKFCWKKLGPSKRRRVVEKNLGLHLRSQISENHLKTWRLEGAPKWWGLGKGNALKNRRFFGIYVRFLGYTFILGEDKIAFKGIRMDQLKGSNLL